MTRRTAAALAAAVTLTAAASTGCTKLTEPGKDAPVAARDDTPADVVHFPDGYSNVSAKCEGPNRVYVAFHGDAGFAAVAVAPNDPRCAR